MDWISEDQSKPGGKRRLDHYSSQSSPTKRQINEEDQFKPGRNEKITLKAFKEEEIPRHSPLSMTMTHLHQDSSPSTDLDLYPSAYRKFANR